MITTAICFGLGGSEMNPIPLSLGIDVLWEMTLFKIAFVSIFCYAFRDMTQILKLAGYFFLVVCTWNIFAIFTYL